MFVRIHFAPFHFNFMARRIMGWGVAHATTSIWSPGDGARMTLDNEHAAASVDLATDLMSGRN